MKTLILATQNPGKVKEIRLLLQDLPFSVITWREWGDIPPVVEDGESFLTNAVKKARHYASYTGHLTLGDDSGLEVDALGGRPGVYSARFAGPGADDAANNAKLLALLHGVPWEKRTARFKCVLAVADPAGDVATVEGVCEGLITMAPQGNNGFGYDPLFYLPVLNATLAQVDEAVKNQFSHRGRAMNRLKELLWRYVQ